jgi:hypothetical protein
MKPQQYARVPIAPTGYASSPYDPNPKPSKTGCEYGWSPANWNRQEWSFIISWLVQLAVLIVSAVALGKDHIPEVLSLVLILETVVQGVEFAWYTIVGVLYLFGTTSIDVGYRYLDWAISTPIMLVSLMFFTLWEANRCTRREDLLGYDGSRVAALIVVIVCDWMMLLVGASYANARPDGTGFWASLSRMYDSIVFFTKRKGDGIFLGWIWFVGAFVPLFVILATDHSKIGGQLAVSLSFVVWALYGVVAVGYYWAGSISGTTANTCYNLLDLLSKNVMGVIVAIVVLNGNFAPSDLQCTVVNGRPWEASVVGNA